MRSGCVSVVLAWHEPTQTEVRARAMHDRRNDTPVSVSMSKVTLKKSRKPTADTATAKFERLLD